MSDARVSEQLAKQLDEIRSAGTFKKERVIDSAQGADIQVGGKSVINLCANNYLGLANHPEIVKAAHQGLDQYGFGMASVRFICGTASPHKQLEKNIAQFFGKEDSITYNSCFDANGGLFETVLSDQDAIISDELAIAVAVEPTQAPVRHEDFLRVARPMSAPRPTPSMPEHLYHQQQQQQ